MFCQELFNLTSNSNKLYTSIYPYEFLSKICNYNVTNMPKSEYLLLIFDWKFWDTQYGIETPLVYYDRHLEKYHKKAIQDDLKK